MKNIQERMYVGDIGELNGEKFRVSNIANKIVFEKIDEEGHLTGESI